MTTRTKTLALLVDADNAQLKQIKQVIHFCKGYGTLSIKKAYGDWKQPPLSAHCQTITELGIERVQQDRVAKNATDFGLAMDVALMLDKGEADIYFIVSNDNHFATVCQRILQKGAQVIGIGSESVTSSKLRKSCNKFFDVETIVKHQSESSKKSSPAPKPKTTPEQAIREILIQAYLKSPHMDGWVLLAQLGIVLRQHDKQFDARFAHKRLSTWFKAYPDVFEVVSDRVRRR